MNVRRCSFGPTRRNVDPHLPSLSLSPSQPSTLTKSNAQPNPSHLHGSPLALMTHAISLLRPHPDPAPPAGHPPAAVASSAFTARWCPSPTPPPPSSSGPGRERRRPPRDGGRHGHSRPCRIPTASSGRACLEMEGTSTSTAGHGTHLVSPTHLSVSVVPPFHPAPAPSCRTARSLARRRSICPHKPLMRC
jgi:hypothetical protein